MDVKRVGNHMQLAMKLASDKEAELARGLDALLGATVPKKLAALLDGRAVFRAEFRIGKTRVDEREFFARCVRHESLHARMANYVRQLAAGAKAIGEHLWQGAVFPAGCFAAVPLVLHDKRYVPLLIEHMRSIDLGHESFYAQLIDRVLTAHGICDETYELLVFRVSDGYGQVGIDNLRRAVSAHGLLKKWKRWGGADGFRDRLSKTKRLRAKTRAKFSMLEIGGCLFPDSRSAFDAWLDGCEKRWKIRFERYTTPMKKTAVDRMPAVTAHEWKKCWSSALDD